jgi:hypothetical protein
MPVVTPLLSAGHIILTTQDNRVRSSEFINRELEVKMLSPDESQLLLFNRAGMTTPQLGEVEVAHALVEELGYLPLAIDSAGAYISVRQKTVQEYADLFHSHQRDMLDHRPDASSYERSVLGALELAFRDIDLRPDAFVLLYLLVYLDRAEVTEQFLRRGVTNQLRWSSKGEPFETVPGQRYVAQKFINLINNQVAFDQAVEDLVSLSTISSQKREGIGRCFSIHSLYHKCAKLRLPIEKRCQFGAEVLIFLAHAFPSDEGSLEIGYVQLPPLSQGKNSS